MTQANATQESLLKLVAVYPKLTQLEHKLQNMSQEIQADFAEVLAVVKELIQPEVEASDNAFQVDYDRFNAVQEAHDFLSIWSIYEVKDLNEEFGFVDRLKYLKKTIKVNKNVTWMELWTLSEQLIIDSGDEHHIFIESFEHNAKKGYYELFTGS